MPIPNGIKVGVAVAAFAAAGYLVWRNVSSSDPNDETFNTMTQYFSCAKDHEFTLTAAETRRNASQNNGIILCPQCQAPAGDRFQCPHCKKLVEPVDHGQMPTSCRHCKQKF